MLVQSQLWSGVGEVFKIVLVERKKTVLNGCKTGFLLSEVRVKIVHIFNRILQNKTKHYFWPIFTLIQLISSFMLFGYQLFYVYQCTDKCHHWVDL